MSDYPMLISNKLHSFRNFGIQIIKNHTFRKIIKLDSVPLMDIESIAS